MSRKAFTLIELLVVIAIIAILAAILFPVFAQAKASAKRTTSLSGLKQVALGLHMYSIDNDDLAVPEYGYPTNPEVTDNPYFSTNTWVGRTFPYIKNHSIYFDKVIDEIRDYSIMYDDPYYTDPYYTYTWAWITTFSMNANGYSRTTASDNPCTPTPADGVGEVQRPLTSFEDPAARLAIAPTRYGSIPNWSWLRFEVPQASMPIADRFADTWSWNALVFDARRQYNTRFIGAFADGHAGSFGPEKFIKRYVDTPERNEMTTFASYCEAMTARDLWKFWGAAWSVN